MMIEFGQPLALLGGLAVGLPIIAHMAYRRVSEKRLFPSLRFLTPTSIPRSGKKRPSDWPLLLLRVLLFVVIMMILADPYWSDEKGDVPANSNREKRIHLVDCSISMSGWGGWNQVQDELLNQWKDDGADHGMIAYGVDGLKVWKTGTSIDELKAGLNLLQPIHIQHQPQSLFNRLKKLWREETGPKKVFVYSDFQVSDWQAVQADVIGLGAELILVPVGHSNGPWLTRGGNQAVIDARVVPGGSGKVRVWAVVRNWDANATPVSLSIFAGGERRETIDLVLPPLGSEQAQFNLPAEDFASASIILDANDSCSWDNNRSLWVTPPPARGFAFFTRSPMELSDQAEKEFLQAVMESVGDGVWNRWTEVSDGGQFDCLLIPGFSDWSDNETNSLLIDHLNGGGTALLTPGESYVGMNQLLRESKLMDFTFNRLLQTEFRLDPYRIEVLDDQNPLSQVFAGDSVRDLYLTQVRRFLSLRDWDDNLECPLYDREGRPLALVRKFPGGGRLVFLCFRLLPDWTDLPTRNSFLPLMVELCDLTSDELLNTGRLVLQSGESIVSSEMSFNAINPGLFQYQGKKISVHAPLAESLPEVMTKNEIQEVLNGSRSQTQLEDTELSEVLPDHSSDQPLWMWFALAAALLLIGETMLSAHSRLSTHA